MPYQDCHMLLYYKIFTKIVVEICELSPHSYPMLACRMIRFPRTDSPITLRLSNPMICQSPPPSAPQIELEKPNATTMDRAPIILLVDDQPINIKLLQRGLEREGMETLSATTGVECLEVVKKTPPDLILLDVAMPEMDGMEACKRLKADPETEAIPVLFITATSSQSDKVRGLSVGAADYITKPIELEETLARVKTQLKIQKYHRQNLELAQRLGDIRKAAAIGSITQGIAHNLNNMLGVVTGYLDILKSAPHNETAVRRSVEAMDASISRIVKIVKEITKVAAQEEAETPKIRCALDPLLRSCLDRLQREAGRELSVAIENHAPEVEKLMTNPEAFETAMVKLLLNAFEACEKKGIEPAVSIDVGLDEGHHQLHVSVLDNGCGIDPKIRESLFEPFVSTHPSVGRGLGLTAARHMAKSVQASIRFADRFPEGSCFSLVLPGDLIERPQS